MMLSLYVPGDSIVHRLPAGTKLLILFAGSVALFAIDGVPVHAGELLVVAGLFKVARLPWRDTLYQLRPALLFLVPIFLFTSLPPTGCWVWRPCSGSWCCFCSRCS